MTQSVGGATVAWTGPAGNSWATGASWSNGSGPGAGDTALFGDGGSATLPGEVTSVLNADRTIGGLTFANTLGKFHTLDLGTRTLNVTGNLNFNLDQPATTTTAIRNGALSVAGAFANINVGRAVSGSANGTADLTGLSSLTASVQEVNVGTNAANGAAGVLKLSPSNNIAANRITVGGAGGDGTLTLGLNNIITAGEFFIANHVSNSLVDIVSGGALNLGTPAQRTVLHVANQNTNTNAVYQGRLQLGNAAVNLHLDSIIVAQKQGGPGNAWGYVTGGGRGSVAIGTSAARGNFLVANTITGGSTIGNVDWTNLDTLAAHVNDFHVGRAQSGGATGSVALPATSTIDVANSLLVGSGSGGSGTLALGLNSTILANEMVVSRDYTSGLVTIRNGGTFNLGSPSRRAALHVAVANKNSNDLHTGTIDLTGGTFHAYLGDVTVGQRDGIGGGRATGTLLAGNGGSVDVGAPGANAANFYVARTLVGGGPAAGTVDFTGLATLNASLNTFGIGVSAAGSALGNVKLAASNTISANSILVGAGGGDQHSTLQLGNANDIQTPQLTIGQDFSSGTVTIRSGGTLTLGSAAQRTNLNLATAGSTNTNNLYVGTLDLSSGTVNAHLGNVVIGSKTLSVGSQQGNLYIGNSAANYVDATSITLGSGTHATGTMKFGGGQLFAGSIAAGVGNANFEWTGGRLGVGTFGTPAIAFNLNNASAGTLAPGSAANAVGTTTIHGTYAQGSAAAMHVEIAGNSPGTGNDLVNVSGAATFAGRLDLDVINNFTPAAGQNFPIANYASRTGTFGFVEPPSLPQNTAFALSYGATQLQVQMVAPVAKIWQQSVTAGTWSTPINWNNGILPTTSSNVSIINNGSAAQKVTVTAPATVHRVTLEGNVGSVELEVLEGTLFGVANELVVGSNATLSGAGEIFGTVVVAGGTVVSSAPERFGTIDFKSGTIEKVNGDLTIDSGGLLGGAVELTAGKHLRVPDGTTTIDAGATLHVDGGTLTTRRLINDGHASVAAGRVRIEPSNGASAASLPGSFTVAGSGVLDVSDNKLVIAGGELGAATGGTYTGVTRLIQTAYAEGGWTGPGITTSMPDAMTGLTTLAIATADQVGRDTFGGVAVGGDDVLVMYTYGGDTNFDGKLDADDYGTIDFSVLLPGVVDGYYNGDFNFDGVVNADDYGVIDFNILAQGDPFPTGSAAAATTGVAAVPEPAAVTLLASLAALCLPRRRRD